MSGGSGLFDRWRTRAGELPTWPETSAPPAVGLQLWLDNQARVLRLSGPLRTVLALPAQMPARLQDYVQPHSLLALEGEPPDWQAHPLDLDFRAAAGHTLHTRGWMLAQPEGWLLQLFDIGDLVQQQRQGLAAQQRQMLASEVAAALRDCSLEHLAEQAGEQLRRLAWHWQAGWAMLWVRGAGGWKNYVHYGDNLPWSEQRLGLLLSDLPAEHLIHSAAQPTLQVLELPFYLMPHTQQHEVQAWLLCEDRGQPRLDDDALLLADALAEPLLARLAGDRLQASQQRLDNVQGLLGAGWWEWSPHDPYLHLAPGLAISFGVPARVTLADWLTQVHPADREAALLAFTSLQRQGDSLQLCLRLLGDTPRWYRLCGELRGQGEARRLHGFMLDISDIKQQEQQASAAHARLDNLIASSPAVIYIQHYDDGALHAEFFSASLQPLLGWQPVPGERLQPAQWVHPDDQPLWLARTRTLLREGQVRSRYRLRDSEGGWHWVLDEARLLRNDLGIPVEAVGIWLDVTETTQAAERVRQSEERYRVLVEDSPAMICRYRPDLELLYGNRPLADYLECTPAQLPGMNLGDWLSPGQHELFVERIVRLSPDAPVSSDEVCLQLPGRQHAWWIWSDRGLFDADGRLLEIQAVGRDNTEVRRSQQLLLQSAKMATLGEMSTGLAHEINQPLNVMRMAVVNALKRLEGGEVDVDYLQEKLKRIDAQVVRASKVVDHMRVFGRRSEVERGLFEPWVAVEGALSLLADGLAAKNVAVRLGDPLTGCPVSGHMDQLEQVLINLMVNARDVLMEKKPEQPWISLRSERDGHWVRLLVEDNGGGIEPRLLECIFEPFFTTKPAGVGTGLGLSVSYRIVESMGGTLSVSNGRDGARFVIELPVQSTS
ncbi:MULTISPECIES: PAS domain-containing sensor histidine kinase [unclassified Pseudomonas]|uniref:PAS domain-containing sensor histidine kinase n=1 Tax=unclassified Pseudomonas TaxID=196821 RepID=UPI0021C8E17A|nr:MULTISPECIES: PAS domain-containing sensor histidine kinase [unclassified Pseudomonas]MCU1730539.1 ATP-binding protein [Pseudomonas sp. 20P_3.2_Bac4]MCU1746436.1 ATP-binding protein [Pseudomonas sp. 20P_3.2_Bac5]